MFSQYQVRLALVGECSVATPAHQAITQALQLAGEVIGVAVTYDWLSPEHITDEACLHGYDGIWCVPSSGCHGVDGALKAVTYARTHEVPFLGTCSGFQLALLEYARNVVGWTPDSSVVLSAPTQADDAALEQSVQLLSGSQIAQLYGVREISEQSLHRYGLSDAFIEPLTARALQASGRDEHGVVRAIELPEHAFFIATLFQPERTALQGKVPPLVAGLVGACAVQVLHEAQLKVAV